MKKTMSIILAAVMLTACAKTPENVRDKEHRENSEIAVTVEKITPSELAKNSEQALNSDYGQIKLQGSVTGLSDTFDKLSFKQVSGFDANYKGVFDSVFGKNGWDDLKVEKKTSPEPEDTQ